MVEVKKGEATYIDVMFTVKNRLKSLYKDINTLPLPEPNEFLQRLDEILHADSFDKYDKDSGEDHLTLWPVYNGLECFFREVNGRNAAVLRKDFGEYNAILERIMHGADKYAK